MDKHRFFSTLYFVLLTCLLILPCPKDVNGAEWKAYMTGEGLLFLYDAEGLNYLPNNMIQVWVKTMPVSEEDRVRYTQKMKKIAPNFPDNWGDFISLYEISCKNKTFTVGQSSYYSVKNEHIVTDREKLSPHQNISPESMIEGLYKILCVEKGSKKKER